MKNGRILGFYSKRWVYFTISIAITIAGIIALFMNGVHLDIQFKGGSLLKYSYEGKIDENVAASVASKLLDGKPVTTQITTDLGTGKKRLVLTIAGNNGLEANKQQDLDNALTKAFPNNNLKLSSSSMVESYYGRKFLRNGIIAIVLASFLVLVYVWIRFRQMGGLSAGVMAVVSLIHDVSIVFFTCVIFQIPIGDSFVAVALTIIGYSINDTIVIYDRIRENNKLHPSLPVDTLADLSISQCMMRSIMTNLAVWLSIGLVYFFARANSIDSIQNFAFPMTVGAISGCYSTICIAGPLWVMWKKHKKDTTLFSK